MKQVDMQLNAYQFKLRRWYRGKWYRQYVTDAAARLRHIQSGRRVEERLLRVLNSPHVHVQMGATKPAYVQVNHIEDLHTVLNMLLTELEREITRQPDDVIEDVQRVAGASS